MVILFIFLFFSIKFDHMSDLFNNYGQIPLLNYIEMNILFALGEAEIYVNV